MTLVYRIVPRLIWVLIPALITLAMAIYGLSTDALRWEDDLAGRWLHASWLLLKLDGFAVFGMSPINGFLEDNGYAYSLHQIGLVGVAVLWSLYVFAPLRSPDAWRFRAGLITYVCLLMVVSSSFYSIKTGALLWFCAGAVDVWRGFASRPEHPPGS
jgi:putative polymerase